MEIFQENSNHQFAHSWLSEEGLGYEDIEAGNADSYDYEATEIYIKADKEDYLSLLTEDLSKGYTLAEEALTLDEDREFDVVVMVGKE